MHLDMVAGLINIIKINYKRVQSLKEFKISSLRNAAGGRWAGRKKGREEEGTGKKAGVGTSKIDQTSIT